MNISICRDGVEIGEWSEEEVKGFYREGKLVATDYYWKEGMAEWAELSKMIKPALPSPIGPSKNAIGDLVFKDNKSAFEYACKFCVTSLENEQPVVAIVLEALSSKCTLKLSNSQNTRIPDVEVEKLSSDSMFEAMDSSLVRHAVSLRQLPELKKGDLVMYVANRDLAAMGNGNWAGTIIAKIRPELSLKNGWGVIEKEADETKVTLTSEQTVSSTSATGLLQPLEEAQKITPPATLQSNELTTVDWVICVLLSTIGCVVGIVRLIQGKPNAGKMLGMSGLFLVIWIVVRVLITVAMNHN